MEQALLNVAQIFTGEINKLEGRKQGSTATISITVEKLERWNSDAGKIKIELACNFNNGTTYETVKAASLGALMDEVYRRSGFADVEALRLDRVEASLQALPAPQQIDDEIPF